MDHNRDENQENILQDIIRGDDELEFTSSFLNDSGEGAQIEAEASGDDGDRTIITTNSGAVY